MRTKADIVSEIKEVLWAIEKDLDPYLRNDIMNYTGYLAENAADLNILISKLLKD